MGRIKRLIICLGLITGISLAGGGSLTFAASTSSSPTDSATSSVCDAINCNDTTTSPSITRVLRLVLNLLTILVGFIAVVMIIINGFRFVTSNGESSKVAAARSGIIYALVGVAVAILAQVMIHFVIGQVSGNGGHPTPPPPTQSQCTSNPKLAGCPSATQCKAAKPPSNCPKKK